MTDHTPLTDTQIFSQKLGRYQVVRELGKGATSAVYLAEDDFAQRQVAIKVAFPGALKGGDDSAAFRNMFLTEASLAGRLVHPHIAAIYDAEIEERSSYIVMEYVGGGTLEQFCHPDNLLKPRDVSEIIFKCVRALGYAFENGLIHRDIKPGNILYAGGTDIKISDFGAAMDRMSDRTIVAAIGSPIYMAPELIVGSGLASHQSDIYALGVVMYYLLSGRLPYAAGNVASLSYQIVNVDPDPLETLRPYLPLQLVAIVKRAMAKEVAKRYQTWEEFGQDLEAAWNEEDKRTEAGEVHSETKRFTLLKSMPFFRDFPEKELWEVLRISHWRAFPPETVLIKEGDVGESFFILAKGSVRITHGQKVINVLYAGDCFGEMSYLARRNGPRSASVNAMSKVIVMKIPAQDLRNASEGCRQQFDRRFLDTLVERLKMANEQLAVAS
jgi:serine/threonine protein kinase